MARRGRPWVDVDLEEVERLASRGLTHEQVAQCLGIATSTLQSRKKQSAAFAEALTRGRAKGIKEISNKFYEMAMEGNVTAAIFWLKNMAGWSDRHELTGKDGGPIEVKETKMLTVVGVMPAERPEPAYQTIDVVPEVDPDNLRH